MAESNQNDRDATTTSQVMRARELFEAYLTRHAANDLEGVVVLFEADARVEDPVGSPTHRGLDAIRAFYRGTHRANGPMSIERVGAVLCGGDEIAADVRAKLDEPGSPPAMDVIYVVQLGESGGIASLRAWFEDVGLRALDRLTVSVSRPDRSRVPAHAPVALPSSTVS